MIDAAEFKKLTPRLTPTQRTSILPPLQAAMTKFNITTKTREAHFLAQVLHESGQFKYRRELASGAAYEGRRDLGNVHPGDGRRYRGRGWIQITGRANYRTYGKKVGLDLENHPELAETDKNAPLIAGAYWDSRGLNSRADRDDFIGITKAINGGTNGLADRRHYLSIAREVLSIGDPDPSEDDGEQAIPLLLRGQELPFDGFLQGGATWAALRPLTSALGMTIQETDGDSALVNHTSGSSAAQEEVPLQIIGGRGFSPVRQVASVAGLQVKMEAGKVLIFD